MRATAASLRLPPPPALTRKEKRSAHAPPAPPIPWIRRWFARPEPSAYQRCLAVHIHFAGPRSALS
jgi:hypothetical protein